MTHEELEKLVVSLKEKVEELEYRVFGRIVQEQLAQELARGKK